MTDSAGRRSRCEVQWVRSQKNGVRLAIKDVATRDQAESLVGCELWIPRSSLPSLIIWQRVAWMVMAYMCAPRFMVLPV